MSNVVFTEDGCYYTAVKDWDEDYLWVRSQDRRSIDRLVRLMEALHPDEQYEVIDRPGWDYQFRVALWREEWAEFLSVGAAGIQAGKIKPAVMDAVGHGHPVYRCVEQVFYFMSRNRTDGSKPNWLRPHATRGR